MECLRCKGEMESGFVGDAGDQNRVRPSVWYSGRPEWSFWGGLKLKGRKLIYVQAMRCVSCGYLESYAIEPSAKK
jgi:hypothetical protein